MTRSGLILALFLFFSTFEASSSCATPIKSKLVGSIPIEGKVVRLNLPHEGRAFKIVWVGEDGREWKREYSSRKGEHWYETRDQAVWRGTAKAIGITEFPDILIKLAVPSLTDEFEIFFYPQLWLGGTVNLLYGYTLFAWQWKSFLFILFLISSGLVYLYRKNVGIALFLGFVIAWVGMDLRSMYDHLMIVKNIEDNRHVNLIKHVREGAKTASNQFDAGTWTYKGLGSPTNMLIKYYLADHRYIPFQPDSQADFIVTKEDRVLVGCYKTRTVF